MQSRLRITSIKSRFSFFIISKNILIRSMYQTVFNVTVYRNKFSHFTFICNINIVVIIIFNVIIICQILKSNIIIFIIQFLVFRFIIFIIISKRNTIIISIILLIINASIFVFSSIIINSIIIFIFFLSSKNFICISTV